MFSKEDLQRQIELGNLIVQKHPTKELYIYNYSKMCMFRKEWNSITKACRGLILDGNGNIVARPFKKFFNLEEHDPKELPKNLAFEVYEKMDGSLGIGFTHEGEFFIASRGSFASIYSQKANEILKKKYSHVKFNPDYTYCFEIIFPGNRVVVDYEGMEDIILLAIIETKTGKDLPLEDIGIPLVKRYDGIKNYKELKKLEEKNKEGFVIKFETGFRVKIKFDDYIRLHSLLSRISNKVIWEHLKAGTPFEELLEVVPDEAYEWVKKTRQELINNFRVIEREAFHEFRNLSNKRVFSDYAAKCKHTGILNCMYDGFEYKALIWDLVRPEFRKGFNDVELPEEEN